MCCCCFHDVSPLQALMALEECSGPQLSWFGYKRLISLFAHTFYVLFCSTTNKRQDGRIPRQSQRRTKNENDAAAENSPRMPLNSLHIDCSLSSYLIILGVHVRVKVCVRFCHKYVRVCDLIPSLLRNSLSRGKVFHMAKAGGSTERHLDTEQMQHIKTREHINKKASNPHCHCVSVSPT